MRDTGSAQVFTLPSDPARLREVRRLVARFALDAGLRTGQAHELAVAFSEVCANVHRHAYGGRRDGRIDVRLVADPERVVVAVAHEGVPLDPSQHAPVDLRTPRDGGYGLYLIARLVDEVSFESAGTSGRVILVKRRAPVPARS